uniref:DUF4939 domain-containing protein n=1 Tax=Cyprinodon variegatus TaxID=28743 RepID=A0A3Q2CNP6_CYPVA
MNQLTMSIQELTNKLSITPPSPAGRRPHPSLPEHYSGEVGKCGGFLLQCSLVFCRSPQSFSNDASKISYLVGLLQGRALQWAEAKNNSNSLFNQSFDDFVSEFKQTFGHAETQTEVTRRLWTQKEGPTCDFTPDRTYRSRVV